MKKRNAEPRWTVTTLFVVVALAALLTGACGGDDDDEPTIAPTDAATTVSATDTSGSSPATSTTTASTATAEAGDRTVQVYFSTGDGTDCSLVTSFVRPIGDDVDPILGALQLLVSGPAADESSAGVGSFFSTATADVVSEVTLSDGLLLIDFVDLRPLLPNASTSCGSAALLAQLNNTALQFPEVERVRYRIDGSCDVFANWLQRECFDINRNGIQLDVPTNERASGSGCTPPAGDGLPDGRWFGIVDDPGEQALSFDLACWFTGTAAAAAAAEDGEESPPPNDYHIRNANSRLRTLAVAPTTEVAWLPEPGNPQSLVVVGYAAWRAQQADRVFQPGVWVTIDDGLVVSIEEQFVP